eukprot:2554912-Pyramimonas_sp.AAC.1
MRFSTPILRQPPGLCTGSEANQNSWAYLVTVAPACFNGSRCGSRANARLRSAPQLARPSVAAACERSLLISRGFHPTAPSP